MREHSAAVTFLETTLTQECASMPDHFQQLSAGHGKNLSVPYFL
jgi:hypothetical protein